MLSLALTLILNLDNIAGAESTPQKNRRCLERPFSSLLSGLSLNHLKQLGTSLCRTTKWKPETDLVFTFQLAGYVMSRWGVCQYIQEREEVTHRIHPKEVPEQKLWGKGCGEKEGPAGKREKMGINSPPVSLWFFGHLSVPCWMKSKGWDYGWGRDMARVRQCYFVCFFVVWFYFQKGSSSLR